MNFIQYQSDQPERKADQADKPFSLATSALAMFLPRQAFVFRRFHQL
jgi:hypothetical protein